jgi:glycine betaine transporter
MRPLSITKVSERLHGIVGRVLGDVGIVFYLSVLIIGGFVALAAGQPEAVEVAAQRILDTAATNFGWMYLVATSGFVVFSAFLA